MMVKIHFHGGTLAAHRRARHGRKVDFDNSISGRDYTSVASYSPVCDNGIGYDQDVRQISRHEELGRAVFTQN
jgi:hypothetical protein